MMRNYVNRFARNSFVRFNSTGTGTGANGGAEGGGGSGAGGGGGNKRPAGPEVLIPLFVGYYLIFKPLEN
jgi:hypothetical protein